MKILIFAFLSFSSFFISESESVSTTTIAPQTLVCQQTGKTYHCNDIDDGAACAIFLNDDGSSREFGDC